MLVLSVEKEISVKVGSLGMLTFNNGLYAYVGSAQSNLEKRVTRHLNKEKRIFWHIDYLLDNENVKIINVFFKASPKIEECSLARTMSELYKPVKGFGSSDCNCPSHLFRIDRYENLDCFLRKRGLIILKLR